MLRKYILHAILGVLLVAACLRAQTPKDTSDRMLAIRAGRLFDGRSSQLLPNQVVLIRGERIYEVGSSDRVKIPSGAEVIDLTRATVLPGLIDAHTHLLRNGTPYDEQLLKESWQYRTIEAVVNARKDLEAGFTTLRDLGTEGAMYSDVDLRRAIDRGLVPGPRLQVATRGISTTGSYALEGYSPEVTVPSGVQLVDTPNEGRLAVREQVKYGADLIKIHATRHFHFTPEGKLVSIPTLTLDEIRAIVDEAHREGLKVACHAYGGEGLQNCVEAGVNSIEHGIDLDEAMIEKMVGKGIYLIPTLYTYESMLLDSDLKATGGKTSRARIHEVSFRRALSRGVKIAFGTDVGLFPHGTQAKEFEYLVRFGMTPAQAIQTATLATAEMMGWEDRIGTIEKGRYADMIAVAGDPVTDITELERITFVMKGGDVVRNDIK